MNIQNIKPLLLGLAISLAGGAATAQQVTPPKEDIVAMTSQWTGDRYADGRPKVSDELLTRLRNISIEEVWGVLRSRGYHNQFEGDWTIIDPDEVMTGRAVTAQYMPLRPDLDSTFRTVGLSQCRNAAGGTNTWPIDVL